MLSKVFEKSIPKICCYFSKLRTGDSFQANYIGQIEICWNKDLSHGPQRKYFIFNGWTWNRRKNRKIKGVVKILLSVDRIIPGKLICEDSEGNIKVIPLIKNIEGIKEGSIIEVLKSGEIILREDEYKKRVERILKLRSKINYEKWLQ